MDRGTSGANGWSAHSKLGFCLGPFARLHRLQFRISGVLACPVLLLSASVFLLPACVLVLSVADRRSVFAPRVRRAQRAVRSTRLAAAELLVLLFRFTELLSVREGVPGRMATRLANASPIKTAFL